MVKTYVLGTGQYRKAIRTRISNLKKQVKVGTDLVSAKFVLRAKRNAPRNSGKLASSIRRRNTKTGYTVLGGYKGNQGFNVGTFTDKRFVIQTSNPFNMFFAPGQSIVYGEPALSPGGNPIRWSALSNPWWSNTVRQTQKEFGKKMINQVRIAMRSA
jgi:hypothetical protein